MTSMPLGPESFEIEAVSPEPQSLENENYSIHTRLNNGNWTSPMALRGIREVRWFLQQNGVDASKIEVAVQELAKTRKANISLV